MGIFISQDNTKIHLFTSNTSYIMEVFEDELLHGYWGKRLTMPEKMGIIPIEEFASFYPNPNSNNKTYSLDTIPREYPDFGRSDYRNPAYRILQSDGTRITKFEVKSLKKIMGKPEIMGLPMTYAYEQDLCETLVVELWDTKSSSLIELFYTVNETYDIITRHTRFTNKGTQPIILEGALSANIDFYNDNDFDLIHFSGSWARERQFNRNKIGRNSQVVESRRGSSSHQQNPFVMLARPQTTEFTGDVYGFNLVYSGSFKAQIEVNSFESTRIQMGINEFDFEWTLAVEEAFYTPEVVLTYSDEGFNGMSYLYHRYYRERLCRGTFKESARPILINNWEATYFSFTQEKLKRIGDAAADIGIELFVLDDGWFGKRDSDKSSLGDWFVHSQKLPHGLIGISEHLKEKNIQFGLWFEPEMISVNSELYIAHPDWCLHVEGHTRTEGRNQLVLDMSRLDVQDYLIEVIGNILRSHPISYVKWDMNRNMTEVGSALLEGSKQGEVTHRYMLGLYRVLEMLTSEFEHILFESCSGGGGRFDPGMLYYMPQTWTSDDTDAFERLFIQYGTSFAYPTISMASHVSVSPNHQVGRSTSLTTRGIVAMMGNLGYELDLSALAESDTREVTAQIAFYKTIREDLQFGRMYRLTSPYSEFGTSVLYAAKDEKTYYLFHIRGLNRPNRAKLTIPLHYLSEGMYDVSKVHFDRDNVMETDCLVKHETVPHDYLNHKGFTFEQQKHDFEATLFVLRKQ